MQFNFLQVDSYHNINSCESTRGVDNLLLRYQNDRKIITDLVSNNPQQLVETFWQHDSPLAIDNECKCQMGHGEMRSIFSCAQCKNFKRLLDFKSQPLNKPFMIQCGKYSGKSLSIFCHNNVTPFLSWDIEAERKCQMYLNGDINKVKSITGDANGGSQSLKCITGDAKDTFQTLKCITGDSFTIRTIIMFMVEKIFQSKNLPHYPRLLTAFICRNKGYSLFETPSIGDLDDLHKISAFQDEVNTAMFSLKSQHFIYNPLKATVVKGIIVQLLVIFNELAQFNFSHGTPYNQSLVFNREPVSYIYEGYHVQAPITVILANLWNASATFNKVHYFPKDVKVNMCLNKSIFTPEIANNNNKFFRLTNDTMDTYRAIRHIGIPIYDGSFDFYCFMVSLMCDKSFHDAVMNHDNLKLIWQNMWLNDEIMKVEKLIKEVHANETCDSFIQDASLIPVKIIRGMWLRCDIVKHLWGLIRYSSE